MIGFFAIDFEKYVANVLVKYMVNMYLKIELVRKMVIVFLVINLMKDLMTLWFWRH